MKTRKIIFALFFTLGLFVFVFVFINFATQFWHDKNVFTASLAQSVAQNSAIDDNSVSPELPDVAEPAITQPIIIEDSKQDQIDDLLEKIDLLKAQIANLQKAKEVVVEEKVDSQKPEDPMKDPIDLPKPPPVPPAPTPPNSQPKDGRGGGTVYLKILISEIQIEGATNAKDEFVELYNPNVDAVDLSDWYVQRKTKTASSFSSYAPNTLFSGKSIPAKGYFVIAREGSGVPFNIQVDNPLTEDNLLVLKNPSGEISDKVGFGQAIEFEGAPTVNPDKGQSIGRKFVDAGEVDTNNNLADFEIDTPTPGVQNTPYVAPPPPDPIVPSKILINEIQTEGATVRDEFVELYNPNGVDINLEDFTLKRKTSTGSTQTSLVGSHFIGIIKAHGFFLIAPQDNDDGSKNYNGTVAPDLRYSVKGAPLASNNTVFLYDKDGVLLDKVGFGTAQDFETAAAPDPQKPQSIGRKYDVTTAQFTDSDNNSLDFVLQDPDPQNSSFVPDMIPPVVSNGLPTGQLPAETTHVEMSVVTNENATCKYSTVAGTLYESMESAFTTTGTLQSTTPLDGLQDGTSYNYYVRCMDDWGNKNAEDFVITFSVLVPDTTPPIVSGGLPSGQLPVGTVHVDMSVVTDESATCKYSTTAGQAYETMESTFATTGGTAHTTPIDNLQDGTNYAYYVRCIDSWGNKNTDDAVISFSILAPEPPPDEPPA